MKKIYRFLSLMLVFLVLAAGCGTKSGETAGTGEVEKEALKLGVIQIVEHPALDASRQGFLDVLAEKGFKEGENLIVDYQNAQGDQSNLKTIATKFATGQMDMVLAIATPSAIAMAGETKEIPVLITAVTDPVAAKLVESNEHPGGNVTGTTDMTPVKEQLELLQKIVPTARKVGVIYNSGEVNSQVQVDIAHEAAQDLGLEIIEATVTGSAEVMQIAQSLIGKVDAFYVPTDNVVASSISSVVAIAEDHDIPLILGERGMVDGGALGTIGIDYYKLGRQTGEMAFRVIQGENPAEMPIESLQDIDVVLNRGAAERMGVTIPAEILEQAKEIIE